MDNELENNVDEKVDDVVDNTNNDEVSSNEVSNDSSLDGISDETFTYTIDNNNVKNDYNKDDDNKSFIYIFIGVFALIGIIVILVIIANGGKSKSFEYSDIESRMVKGAKSYFAKHEEMLPVMDDSSVSVSTDTLISESFLKPFSEMVDEDVSCEGYVNVFKSNDEYVYFPYLNCSDYESMKLSNKIIDDSYVTSGDGLYQTNDGYVFRGEFPNNYVNFSDKSWRIIGINSDGSIRLIYNDKKIEKNVWDDRYNSDKEGYVGINDFSVSRILMYLKEIYDNNTYVNKNNKDLLVKHDWCIGKISESDASISSLNLCSDVYSDLYIGVVKVDDVLIPSLDSNCTNLYDFECTNYNYFFNINTGWTLNSSSDKSYSVFSSSNGSISFKNASATSYIRPVINVNGNILYKSGNGTSDDPYKIGD